MSVAASRPELETSHTEGSGLPNDTAVSKLSSIKDINEQHEHGVLEKLTGPVHPGLSTSIIAVDLDDVLCQTNEAVAEWHNRAFGTKMDISTFYCESNISNPLATDAMYEIADYYYWKNPFWGTVKETFDKVKDFYKTDAIYRAAPVPGAQEGIRTLKTMGFQLIIVTARHEENADESWNWVSKHFPGLFDRIVCTGQFKDAPKTGHEVVTKLRKSQICYDLGAKLLIDDSAENALQCATAIQPTPVLLFGNYEWNQRVSGANDAHDDMSFDIRFKSCGGKEFWKEETLLIPRGARLWRVKDWSEVIQWVRHARLDGRI